jgi:hypothetical protein
MAAQAAQEKRGVEIEKTMGGPRENRCWPHIDPTRKQPPWPIPREQIMGGCTTSPRENKGRSHSHPIIKKTIQPFNPSPGQLASPRAFSKMYSSN